jgi:hypothetical protein
MIGVFRHYWGCTATTCAYLRERAFERTTLAAIFGGAPLMYAAPTKFWQAFVAAGIVVLALMPSPSKPECGQ